LDRGGTAGPRVPGDLLEPRAIVEPIVARLAAERASHETIAAIERAFQGVVGPWLRPSEPLEIRSSSPATP